MVDNVEIERFTLHYITLHLHYNTFLGVRPQTMLETTYKSCKGKHVEVHCNIPQNKRHPQFKFITNIVPFFYSSVHYLLYRISKLTNNTPYT